MCITIFICTLILVLHILKNTTLRKVFNSLGMWQDLVLRTKLIKVYKIMEQDDEGLGKLIDTLNTFLCFTN